eukprot:CAMPEP_0182943506 /NCGR_PEP_ID=MMETSP0105_2-20130417/52519_1 /TAXON_ID=81532 ORGANISM="Acanthoeca-like sp., Strain 10tr" /NCGR_SAMPLE_ID=MMETSP0105_2 /ASSEMBLY_ACC=CAM_ASM_000205 /LENGTH=52 /DNA_ID=CAMNT_0025083359 /DNA_START=46 /DNA_END=201 /DNA_ORIENTATION=-
MIRSSRRLEAALDAAIRFGAIAETSTICRKAPQNTRKAEQAQYFAAAAAAAA